MLDHGQGKLVRRVELRPENSVVQALFAVFLQTLVSRADFQ